MSEENKWLARRVLEGVYAHGDAALADVLVHPDFADHEPAHPERPAGPAGVMETVRSLHAAFSDLRFTVEDELAEDDRVVQRVTMSGRHTGPMLGRPPTGRPFAVRHAYFWRIAPDGRIIEHWGSWDDLGLLRQLGLLDALSRSGEDEHP